jgi:hypothetical protein
VLRGVMSLVVLGSRRAMARLREMRGFSKKSDGRRNEVVCVENGDMRSVGGRGWGGVWYICFVDFLSCFSFCVGGFCVSFFLLSLSFSGSSICMIPRYGC